MDHSTTPEPKMTRRGLLRAGVRIGIGSMGLTAAGLGWAHNVEPDWVQIERLKLKLPRLPQAFDGLRMAQISDIHIEGGDMRHRFNELAETVTGEGPDLIVLTGDYTSYKDNWQAPPLIDGFKRLSAPLGVYGVMGNHDYWDADISREALRRGGVRELRNEAIELKKGGQSLLLCGLDDWMERAADLPALLEQVPPDAGAILLLHEPDPADIVAPTGRFDLMLSGHSHGGQVVVPGWGPIKLPPLCHKYPRGLYQNGTMQHYTNRGLGVVDLPIRFGSRPEITIFTLKSA